MAPHKSPNLDLHTFFSPFHHSPFITHSPVPCPCCSFAVDPPPSFCHRFPPRSRLPLASCRRLFFFSVCFARRCSLSLPFSCMACLLTTPPRACSRHVSFGRERPIAEPAGGSHCHRFSPNHVIHASVSFCRISHSLLPLVRAPSSLHPTSRPRAPWLRFPFRCACPWTPHLPRSFCLGFVHASSCTVMPAPPNSRRPSRAEEWKGEKGTNGLALCRRHLDRGTACGLWWIALQLQSNRICRFLFRPARRDVRGQQRGRPMPR